MQEYQVSQTEINVPLGRQGENLATAILFDVSEWQSEYGAGTPMLLHLRSGDTLPYVATVTLKGEVVRWELKEEDTCRAGGGKVELQWRVGDTIVKSKVYTTIITSSLGDITFVPTEETGWLNEVLAASKDAQENEKKRVAAEKERETAEAERVKAEVSRVEAEKKRVEEFDGMKEQLAGMVDNILLEALFRLPRTGKVYTVKIPKFAANPTTVCEKLDDNAGLVCEPSTDTVEGQDDYADIPLFKWYNCNYKRDKYGHAYPTAIEGLSEDYTTEGNIDIGVIQMAPYIKWDNSNEAYTILSIADSPKDGYTLWYTARSNGQNYPYVIHSKCFSSLGDDGLPRSIFGRKPIRNESYNNIITEYGAKGEGYFGAKAERNTWQIVFTLIKYAKKSSRAVFTGCIGYSYQYSASIRRTEKLPYFPVTNAQAATLVVGSYVSVGYGYISSGAISLDRSVANLHKYADDVKILKIEDLGGGNSAVYLDCEPFDTTPVALSDTLTAPITLSTMHWHGGSTNVVVGHHDGSPHSNTDGTCIYRVQGVEYAAGGYFVAADSETVFAADNTSKNVLVCPPGVKNTSNEDTIRATHTNVGTIPGGDFWIGDIDMDVEHCTTWPAAKGSGNSTGTGDYNYGGGTANSGTLREYLLCGGLWDGLNAGSSYLHSRYWFGFRYWNLLAAD